MVALERQPFPLFIRFHADYVYLLFPDTKNPGHYTTNPQYFVKFITQKIFTM
jgi:hypothetical protein